MDFSKKLRVSSSNKLIVAILLAILLVFNYIASNHYFRIDLTEENRYTLSDSTKEMLKYLDDVVNIKVYFSKSLPPYLLNVSEGVSDIMEEYQSRSNNTIKVSYIDPGESDELAMEAQSIGIQQVQLNVFDDDKFQVQNGFLGIAIYYGDEYEVLPIVTKVENLEYDLTSIIKKLTADELKKVGFLTGHSEHPTFATGTGGDDIRAYTELKAALEKNYEIETSVDLSSNDFIKEIDTLIVGGPRKDFTEREQYELDQFIMRGGNVVFLIDGVDIMPDFSTAEMADILVDFLAHYGVKVNHNLLYDISHENATFNQGIISYMIPYPFWVKVIGEQIESSNPIVAKLESLVLPWVSTLDITEKEGISYEKLVQSTTRYGVQAEEYDLAPQQEFPGFEEEKDPVTLAVLLKGQTSSFYKDKDIPAKEGENIGYEEKLDESQEEFKIAVVGDSDFINNQSMAMFPSNYLFILNTIDYLTLDESLMEIRAKNIQERPIDETLSDSSKVMWKVFGMGFAPVILIIYGFARLYKRKKNKKSS